MKNDVELGPFFETASGGRFFFQHPEKSDILIDDIATALSRICRFNGQSLKFYSVAEHSVLMARYIWRTTDDRELAFAALMHDAGEAYLGDVVKPLKSLLPDYQKIEQACDTAVLAVFGIETPLPPAIKDIDTRILLAERAQALRNTDNDWGFDGIEPLPVTLHFWTAKMANVSFMAEFYKLAPVNLAA